MSRRRHSVRAGPPGSPRDDRRHGTDLAELPASTAPADGRRRASPDHPDAGPREAPLAVTVGSARVPAAALLPLRLFLGVTFVYAGIDKLIDPAFFNASDPASIQSQLLEFARVSPLGPLVQLSEPFAVPIGFLIALAEIAIGLGALTGLAYRVAAAAGAALSLLFFLTASWSTQPYYFGPDLPYAAGWLTLALAGHGGLLVPRAVLQLGRPAAEPRGPRRVAGAAARGHERPPGTDDGALVSRRSMMQVGVLAIATLLLATATTPLRLFRGSTERGTASRSPSPGPGGSPPAPAPTASPLQVARVSDVPQGGALPFTVPMDAPSSLPAGDPAVIVRLPSGSFVAYDAVCTHEGCTVEWAGQDSILFCPCHGAAFDAATDGEVIQGPARRPLTQLPLVVDAASGTISLQA
jgi:thiosulfate dehydrogenase (quinone) large subunit